MDLPHFEHVEAAIDRAAQALPAIEAPADRSHWAALEALIGPALIGQFMFMGEATTRGDLPLYLYKHGATRCYLNVAADLSTWTYCAGPTLQHDGRYERCNMTGATSAATSHKLWPTLSSTPRPPTRRPTSPTTPTSGPSATRPWPPPVIASSRRSPAAALLDPGSPIDSRS